jgi:biofilm PGA synthesis N-glycosyltransferase PgaC
MEILSLVFVLVSLPLLWSGMLNLFYIPLSLVFELRRWRMPTHRDETTALVSIVVPAYNEGRVIVACVESILACPYPNKEIILVNDGSTDDTLAQMQRFCDYENVVIIDKPNGGKASALNAGLARARRVCLLRRCRWHLYTQHHPCHAARVR